MISDMKQIEKIGNRIRQLRNAEKISQEELSEKSGLTRAYINRVENGQAPRVSVVSIMAIARALEVPVSSIFDEAIVNQTAKAIDLIRAALQQTATEKKK